MRLGETCLRSRFNTPLGLAVAPTGCLARCWPSARVVSVLDTWVLPLAVTSSMPLLSSDSHASCATGSNLYVLRETPDHSLVLLQPCHVPLQALE